MSGSRPKHVAIALRIFALAPVLAALALYTETWPSASPARPLDKSWRHPITAAGGKDPAKGAADARFGDLLLVVASTVWLAVCAFIFWLSLPPHIFLFHAPWVLHPFEQEHLTIARHFAEHGSLTIRDAWFGQPAHASEDGAFAGGALVPRGGLLVYLIYAVPFLLSDTAWLWVTPLFGVIAAAAVFTLIKRRTGSALIAALSVIAFSFTAPVMIAASGLVYDNLIALAFLLWALYALDRYADTDSHAAAVCAGSLFGCAALVRPDYVPAGLLAVTLVAAVAIARAATHQTRRYSLTSIGLLAVGVVGALVVTLVANLLLYGGVLNTGYGATVTVSAPVWSGSTDGVITSLRTFDVHDFLPMARTFLFDIGGTQVALLVVGVVFVVLHRSFRIADVVLVGFSAFLVVLNLGHSGAHGGVSAILVHSPPRYLLPVYTAGVVLGLPAMARIASAAPRQREALTRVAVAGVVLVIAGRGLHEAYGTPYGFVEERRTTERDRAVYEFAKQHPDAVFVGDLYTKAIIGQRTIIPRLLTDVHEISSYVDEDLAAGRRVFLVDNRDYLAGFPEYSGYYETLLADGFVLLQVSDDPQVVEVHEPAALAGGPLISLLSPRDGAAVSGAIKVTADAAGGGGISSTQLALDGVPLFRLSDSAPYVFDWDTRAASDGDHLLSVTVTDAGGVTATIARHVHVSNNARGAPRVALRFPHSNDVVSGTVPVLASANDPDKVAEVRFYIDGTYQDTVPDAPYVWNLDSTTLTSGMHSIWVKAVDRTGADATTYVIVYVRNYSRGASAIAR